ncbi:MAG: Smr/MutS family protein [Anaerolineae bacterium]
MRGQRVEDALSQLDGYINAAYGAGLPFARIIHGKGTGALRKAVREIVDHHPLIARAVSGEAKEGGDGVTVDSSRSTSVAVGENLCVRPILPQNPRNGAYEHCVPFLIQGLDDEKAAVLAHEPVSDFAACSGASRI